MAQAGDRKFREVFFAFNGSGPYSCEICGEEVDFWSVLIHHRNHDHDDNRLENLGPVHRGCHTKHHSTGRDIGKKHSESTRQKMSEAQSRRWANTTQEERKRIGQQAADNRSNQGEIMKKAWETRRSLYGPSGVSAGGDLGPGDDS